MSSNLIKFCSVVSELVLKPKKSGSVVHFLNYYVFGSQMTPQGTYGNV